MNSFEPERFELWSRGNKLGAFSVGATYTHHWGRTITDADNVVFSTVTCNWAPMYLNNEYAKGHGHPTAVVNPMLLLCTAVGLSVEDLSEGGGPFLGVDDCCFHKPVYVGDTIYPSSEVLDIRHSQSRPNYGIITWRTQVTDQRDELVLTFQRTNLVAK